MNPIRTGQFIRIRRKRLGLSQSKLAEMLCVEPQTVSKWERGLGMPDYDNVDKLRSIFGCSLTDILEPDPAELGEAEETEKAEENETPPMLLPALVPFMQENGRDGDGARGTGKRKKGFRFFDFLNKRKIKETLEGMFGYEYANTYNEKFLFRGLFAKHSREECEDTLTQGMFRDRVGHCVIGIEAPWLYFRLFLFLLICTGISALLLGRSPMPFVIFGGMLAVFPLLLFLFESNFPRNLSLPDVLRMFAIGGLLSVLTVLLVHVDFIENTVLQTVVVAPITEELAKALLVVIFVAKYKPTNMLTGLLIGFSVGAGFTFLENWLYVYDFTVIGAYLDGFVLADIEALAVIITRTVADFFMGHHYWAAIFGGVYVLFKSRPSFELRDLFQGKVLLSLAYAMGLHALWNGTSFIEVPFIPFLLRTVVCVLSVVSLIVLINVGVAQTRIRGIWEDYRSEHKDETAAHADAV